MAVTFGTTLTWWEKLTQVLVMDGMVEVCFQKVEASGGWSGSTEYLLA